MAFMLSDELADKLLDKLSTDDTFRAHFQSNPRAALASIGFAAAANAGADEHGLWSCCAVPQLASKEAIAASRDELRKQFQAASPTFNPISLKA
jgi:putative modified peptide